MPDRASTPGSRDAELLRCRCARRLALPGGTSAALAEELKAAAAGGYRTAILPLKGPVLRRPHPMHPEIAAPIAAGSAELVDPLEEVECGLLLVHHPQLLTHAPQAPLRLRADQRLIVAHHPPFDAEGPPFYDWRRIHGLPPRCWVGRFVWAPVGPIVRAQLAAAGTVRRSRRQDWVNVLDPEPWRVPREDLWGSAACIGRHSRPDPLKWPAGREAVLEVYPDDPRFLVRILGGGPFLDQLLDGPPPANWEVLPFAPGPHPPSCAARLLLYYHHPRWVEAFGRTVLEAMAAGCAHPAPGYGPLFGDGALYAEPAAAAAAGAGAAPGLAHFGARRGGGDAYARALRARGIGHGCASLLGPAAPRLVPGGAADRGWARRGPRRVLFMTSNGIGLGHLTRCWPWPDACRPRSSPWSSPCRWRGPGPCLRLHGRAPALSRVCGGRREPLEPLPAARARGDLRFHDPAVIVFDGNMPYGGLLEPSPPGRELVRLDAAGPVAAGHGRRRWRAKRGSTSSWSPASSPHADRGPTPPAASAPAAWRRCGSG